MFKKLKNKSTILKIFILVVIFVVIILVFLLGNFGKDDKVEATLDKATLPVIYMSYDSMDINMLYGYTQKMDALYMRDTITPLQDDYTLGLKIDKCEETIKSISYIVKSIDGENLVQESEAKDFTTENGVTKVTLDIEKLIENDVEYVLEITVSTSKHNEINYYTRIVKSSENYYEEQISFAENFRDMALEGTSSDDLAPYLETNTAMVDNSNLGYVTINSTSSRVGWCDLKPEIVNSPKITIKELFSNVGCIQFNYMVSVDKSGVTEYYNVTEFFRIRVGSTKTYLLDYERTTNQIFEPSEAVIGSTTLNLGIDSDSDIELVTDSKGEKVCFVKEGSLWCMDLDKNDMTDIFSFSKIDTQDIRFTHYEHDIKVINVDDNGNIEFLVYGYMNSGAHEGNVGIALYEYTKESNSVEEILFVPSNRSFCILQETLGELLYVSDSGSLFLMLDDYIYSIDLSGKEYVEVASGIRDGNYVVSYDSGMVAWHEGGSVNDATKISVLDFETGNSCTVKAEAGTRIKALGFLGDDFVYGIASESEISTTHTGETTFLMHSVKVVNYDLEVQQQEDGNGMYFTGAQTGYNAIVLSRITANIETAEPLTIFVVGEREDATTTYTTTDESKKKILWIKFLNKAASSSLKVTEVAEYLFENSNALSVRNMVSTDARYYVYASGKVSGIYSNLAEAVVAADNQTGVVIGDNQQYIWIRGGKKTSATLAGVSVNATSDENNRLAACTQALLSYSGVTDVDVASEVTAGTKELQVINDNLEGRGVYLSGLTLDQVLYFVSVGEPIIAMTGEKDCVVITGYTSNSITVIQSSNGETETIPLGTADQMFANVDYKYITLLND